MNSPHKSHLFLFIFILAKINFCFAQENIDSLKLLLSKSEPDTNRVNILNRLSWNLRSIDPVEALKKAEQSKKLALRLGYEKGTATSYNNIGVIEYRRGEYSEAINSHLQALSIRLRIGDREGMALSYINLGNVYSEQANNALALVEYLKAEKILNETKNEKRLLLVYVNVGTIKMSENKLEEGLAYSIKARTLAKKLNNQTVEAEALNNIGVVKEAQLKFDEAMTAYLGAYEISKSIEDKTSMVDNMINIGDMCRMQKKFDEAISWHRKTEILGREIGYLEGIRVLYENFSKDYKAIGDYENALNYHIRFKELNDSLFNADNISKINSITEHWNADRKEKELIELQQELKSREWSQKQSGFQYWAIIGGIVLILFSGIYVLKANKKYRKAEVILKSVEIKSKEGAFSSGDINSI